MSKEIIHMAQITRLIHALGEQKVMLDVDLAMRNGVSTGALNRAVKRNASRFPADFMFQVTPEEAEILKRQFGISSWGGRRTRPNAFTEQGVAMLSSVLRSERAVKVNIAIMRAFVKLREALETNRELAKKFSELEERVGRHDDEIATIIEAIRQLITPPDKPHPEIGFHVRESSARYRTRKCR